MKVLIFLVVFLLVAFGVLAYTQGWINFGKDDKGHVKVTFDKEKFKKDKETAADKIAELRNKSKSTKGEDKTKLDAEIAALQKELDELGKNDAELDEKDERKLEALQKKITELVNKSKKEKNASE